MTYTSACLLKTATTDISVGSNTVLGHIHKSFISEEFAYKLQIMPIRHKQTSVLSFDAQVLATKKEQ